MNTTQRGPLRWRAGTGWLILAGGGRWQSGETGDLDAAILNWADLDRPIAALLTAGSMTADGEALLEYYAELGGPSGYIVPILDASDARQEENCRLLAQAGLVYIADGPDELGLVKALYQSPALDALAQAFETGAAVAGVGAGAAALGAWVASPNTHRQGQPAWGWLPNIIVEPHFIKTEATSRLASLLNAHPDCLGLGLPDGLGLGLGPDGRVMTLGRGSATVVIRKADRDSEKGGGHAVPGP